MKKRNQIDEKYKWDLELFKSEAEIEEAFNDLKFLTEEFPKFKNQFTNKDKFFEYFLNYKKIFF